MVAQTIENLGQVDQWHGRYRLGGSSLWERLLTRYFQITLDLAERFMIDRRRLVCHLAAALFSVCVVIPAVLVFGNRALPFEIAHVFFKPEVAHAGDTIMLHYTLIGIEKECGGAVDQSMIDAVGNVFDTGTIPVLYSSRQGDAVRNLIRPKVIPQEAKPGPALYRAKVSYWCNPMQRLYPISRIVEAPFTIY